MVKYFFIIFFFIIWGITKAQNQDLESTGVDSLKSAGIVGKLFDFADKTIAVISTDEWVFLPAAVYSPETSLGLGFRAIRIFKTAQGGNTRPSSIPITILGTLNKQTLLTVEWERWGKDNEHQLHSRWEFHDFPFRFYGLGSTFRSDNFENYASKILYGHIQYHKKLGNAWYIGPRLEVGAENVYQKEEAGLLFQELITGANGYFLLGAGADIILDTRDQIFAPQSGWLSKFSLVSFQEFWGSEFTYTHYTIDIRKYISFKNHHVLALQSYIDWVSGEVPFQKLPRIGGSDLMRGFFEGKYRGQRVLVQQAEYRFPVYRNLGMVVYSGLGQMSYSGTSSIINPPNLSGGIGFRYKLNKEGLNIRIDIGYGDQRAFYFGLGEVI